MLIDPPDFLRLRLVRRGLAMFPGRNLLHGDAKLQSLKLALGVETTQRRPKLCELLQRKTASFRPELPNPGRGLRERTP